MWDPLGLGLPPILGPFNCEEPASFEPDFLVALLEYSGGEPIQEC